MYVPIHFPSMFPPRKKRVAATAASIAIQSIYDESRDAEDPDDELAHFATAGLPGSAGTHGALSAPAASASATGPLGATDQGVAEPSPPPPPHQTGNVGVLRPPQGLSIPEQREWYTERMACSEADMVVLSDGRARCNRCLNIYKDSQTHRLCAGPFMEEDDKGQGRLHHVKCFMCGRDTSLSRIFAHVSTCPGPDGHRCSTCPKVFKYAHDLNRHVCVGKLLPAETFDPKSNEPLPCPHCGKPVEQGYRNHFGIHVGACLKNLQAWRRILPDADIPVDRQDAAGNYLEPCPRCFQPFLPSKLHKHEPFCLFNIRTALLADLAGSETAELDISRLARAFPVRLQRSFVDGAPTNESGLFGDHPSVAGGGEDLVEPAQGAESDSSSEGDDGSSESESDSSSEGNDGISESESGNDNLGREKVDDAFVLDAGLSVSDFSDSDLGDEADLGEAKDVNEEGESAQVTADSLTKLLSINFFDRSLPPPVPAPLPKGTKPKKGKKPSPANNFLIALGCDVDLGLDGLSLRTIQRLGHGYVDDDVLIPWIEHQAEHGHGPLAAHCRRFIMTQITLGRVDDVAKFFVDYDALGGPALRANGLAALEPHLTEDKYPDAAAMQAHASLPIPLVDPEGDLGDLRVGPMIAQLRRSRFPPVRSRSIEMEEADGLEAGRVARVAGSLSGEPGQASSS